MLSLTRQEGAVATACLVAWTLLSALTPQLQREVTDARGSPQVVQGREDGLTKGSELSEGGEGEEALVDPMQVKDIGLPYPRVRSDITAPACRRDAEEVLT